ncbi:MAG: hypothetical protein LBP99_05150 [Azoarcus sp.]|jgi:hypothetical protein|nr:hypothetical protein [Azoarcus sp.]
MSLISRHRRIPALILPAFCLGLACVLYFSPALAGENVTYPGAALQTIYLKSNSLAPSGSADPYPNKSNSLSGNTVILNSGTVNAVWGALNFKDTDAVTGNQVFINGGTVNTYNVYGGEAWNHTGVSGAATDNSVTISGGLIKNDVRGGRVELYSGGAATATGNTVTMTGGTVDGYIYAGGAYIYDDAPGDGIGTATATGNSVTVTGGTVGDGDDSVWGGRAFVESGGTATASNNRVIISGGVLNGDVLGGYIDSDAGIATTSNNIVTISNGQINGSVYGGYIDSDSVDVGTATNNVVTLSGAPIFAAASELYGGYIDPDVPTRDAFTGNTLNVWNYSGSPVGSVANFQYFNFALSSSLTGGLHVTDNVDFRDPDVPGRTSTVTGVKILGSSQALQPGQKITLIHADNGFDGTVSNNGQTLVGKKGGLTNVLLRLDQQVLDLYAIVEGTAAAPEAKSLSEGRTASHVFVGQGADLVAGKGMGEAVRAARLGVDSHYGLKVFGALFGGWSRYHTGSHVDVSGLSLISGLSFGAKLSPGLLTLAGFFEYGSGSYNTHNSFSHAADVDGKGDTHYLGGGILGRMDFIETGPGHFYTEGSFRAGGVHNKYKSADLRDGMDREADFTANSAYHGLHFGAGYIWNLSEKASLDLYAKYLWTHQEGKRVHVLDDPVKFKNMDSHRLRIGGRFAHAVNDYIAPYIGAAYEHEFDGRARATVDGNKIATPDLIGGTGIGELGVTMKPSKNLPLSVDLGVQGYVGKREGVSGSLHARYEF